MCGGMFKNSKANPFSVLMILFFLALLKETVDVTCNMGNKTEIRLSIIYIKIYTVTIFVCIGRNLMAIEVRWCKWSSISLHFRLKGS